MTDIEKEVSEAIAANPHYPLGETDAMKWAVAWRHIRDRNGIDANASQAGGDIDGWMVGWFANCMASASPQMLITRATPSPTLDKATIVERALQRGLEIAVLTLAFHARDRGTDRESKMLDGLKEFARQSDPIIRAAIRREGMATVGEGWLPDTPAGHAVEAMLARPTPTPTPNAAADALAASLLELLEPLERASAEMVKQGKSLNEAGEAAFDRARDALATYRQQQPGKSSLNDEGKA